MKYQMLAVSLCVILALTFPIIGHLLDRIKVLKSRIVELETAWPTSEYPLPDTHH